ncbi:MAG TPA: transglutaminase-like domain-containing protein, partial [Planctomycetota bacterium]|nr:transglutaminase-like domain-containing protein [Planctomycetota bacterium]
MHAAISLLAEPEAHIVQAVREQLLRWGSGVRPELLRAAENGAPVLRVRARALLRAMEVRGCLQRFAGLELDRGGRRDAGPLLHGAVMLSQMARTFAPGAAELQQWLRGEAEVLRHRIAGRSVPTCARLLGEHLGGELGCRGGDASCLDYDHVLLDRVLLHRVGIPVSLSLVYLLVARWAGLPAAGVAMPDHFLVRIHGVRPALVDPYHGGRTVTKADCVRYLRSNGYDGVNEHLRDLSDREMLAHYLRSLKRAAAYRGVPDTQRSL